MANKDRGRGEAAPARVDEADGSADPDSHIKSLPTVVYDAAERERARRSAAESEDLQRPVLQRYLARSLRAVKQRFLAPRWRVTEEHHLSAPVLVAWAYAFCFLFHDWASRSWLTFWYRWTLGAVRDALPPLDGVRVQLRESTGETVALLALGALVGLGLARLRFRREERRSVLAAALETQPGFRYLRSVLTQLPDYVTLGEGGETCEWLTKLVAQVFPAVQASLSSIISQFLEPVLDHSKPPGIRSLKIIKVDIGTKPLQFLDVRTVPFGNEDERQFAMDFDMVFDSELDAQMAIQLAQITSIAQVKDLKLQATLRVLFAPLGPKIPVIRALSISFARTPTAKFQVRTKGTPLPAFVLTWISNIITEMVLEWFVWPERVVVPIDTSVPAFTLEPHPLGVILVKVKSLELMEGVHANAIFSKRRRVRLKMWTRAGGSRASTISAVPHRISAIGQAGQHFEFVVKEPASEPLFFVLESVGLRASLRVISAIPVARATVLIQDVIDDCGGAADTEVNYGVRLAQEDFHVAGGREVAMAEVGLRYNRVEDGLDSEVGAVWVRVVTLRGIPRMDVMSWADPYLTVKLPDVGGKYKRTFSTRSKSCRDDRTPVFVSEQTTFMDVQLREERDGEFLKDATGDQRRVIIELWESDYLKDDYVGRWEVALEEVVGRGGHYVGTVVIEGMCPSSLIVPDCRKPKWEAWMGVPYEPQYSPASNGMSKCRVEMDVMVSWLGYN